MNGWVTECRNDEGTADMNDGMGRRMNQCIEGIGTQRGQKIPTPPFDIICILGLNTKLWILFCLYTYAIILIHSPSPMPSVTLTHLQLLSPILETVPVGGFWLHEVWPFVWAMGISP